MGVNYNELYNLYKEPPNIRKFVLRIFFTRKEKYQIVKEMIYRGLQNGCSINGLIKFMKDFWNVDRKTVIKYAKQYHNQPS